MLDHEIVPPLARPSGYHCLVLHGLGDSLEGWKPAAPLFALDRIGWVFANAPEPYGPYGGFAWFDLGPGMTPDLAGVSASRRQLEALIDHLLATLAIPSERLFLMGFSQGCLMALETALRGERRFAGVVGISGWISQIDSYPEAFGSAGRDQHLIMTHGRTDELLPIELVRRQAQTLKGLGVDLIWSEYDKTHTLDPEEEVADIRAWMLQRMG